MIYQMSELIENLMDFAPYFLAVSAFVLLADIIFSGPSPEYELDESDLPQIDD